MGPVVFFGGDVVATIRPLHRRSRPSAGAVPLLLPWRARSRPTQRVVNVVNAGCKFRQDHDAVQCKSCKASRNKISRVYGWMTNPALATYNYTARQFSESVLSLRRRASLASSAPCCSRRTYLGAVRPRRCPHLEATLSRCPYHRGVEASSGLGPQRGQAAVATKRKLSPPSASAAAPGC